MLFGVISWLVLNLAETRSTNSHEISRIIQCHTRRVPYPCYSQEIDPRTRTKNHQDGEFVFVRVISWIIPLTNAGAILIVRTCQILTA
jgi:hypothetical protein